MMKIKKAYWALTLCNRHVLETLDGKYMSFPMTYKHVTERDLTPVPAWKPVGKATEELPTYMLPIYGLEKE